MKNNSRKIFTIIFLFIININFAQDEKTETISLGINQAIAFHLKYDKNAASNYEFNNSIATINTHFLLNP